jgi:SAM-dependent methyltransferase
MPAPEHPRAASVAEATPQQALATVYDEGAVAYESYWALVSHRHAIELVDAVPAAEPQTGLTPWSTSRPAPGLSFRRSTDLRGPEAGCWPSTEVSGCCTACLPRRFGSRPTPAALPLAPRSVDVLVLAFVPFMLPDAGAAVIEVARVLRPGGWLLAATWGLAARHGCRRRRS